MRQERRLGGNDRGPIQVGIADRDYNRTRCVFTPGPVVFVCSATSGLLVCLVRRIAVEAWSAVVHCLDRLEGAKALDAGDRGIGCQKLWRCVTHCIGPHFWLDLSVQVKSTSNLTCMDLVCSNVYEAGLGSRECAPHSKCRKATLGATIPY